MRARNVQEREILGLYRRLPALTAAQQEWIKGEVVERSIYSSGKKCWCTVCGQEWKGTPEGETAVCPHCGAKSAVQRGRNTTHKGLAYAQFFTVFKGWQVIRYVLVRWNCKRGREQIVQHRDVFQKWCRPGRPMVTLGASLAMFPNYRAVPYSSSYHSLSIKPNHEYWYTEWMRCETYPKMSLLPVYAKHIGRRPNFDNLDMTAPTLLGDVFGCPYLEKLWKAKEWEKLMSAWRHVDELNKYWPSVRVALRHGYEPEDWGLYFEHLRALKYLRYDMKSPRYVAPEDFGQLHDLITRQYKNKRDAIERKRDATRALHEALIREEMEKKRREGIESFTKRVARFAGLKIEDCNIVIVPLDSIEAFKEEGEAMHHCVFNMGYYAKPESLILSARNRTDGERVETIEVSLSSYRILQSRGIYNSLTERHDEICGLVNNAMPQIRQMAMAT